MAGNGKSGRPNGPRDLTPEEQQLWEVMTRDVTPMAHDTKSLASIALPGSAEPGEIPASQTQTPSTTTEKNGRLLSPRVQSAGMQPPPQPKPTPRLEVGNLAGVDRRTADRLRRGQMTLDARLDLHGMTRAAAQDMLSGFIARSAGRGDRCVLVITGKGRNGGEAGVLRREVPHWLNLPHLRPKIVAVTQAQQRHGGGGALYILLKRQR